MKQYAVIETEVGVLGEMGKPSKTWVRGYDCRRDAEQGMAKAFRTAVQAFGDSLSYCHFDTGDGEARLYDGDSTIHTIALKDVLKDLGDEEV